MSTDITTPFTIIREYDQIKLSFTGETGLDQQSWSIFDITFTTDPNTDFVFIGNILTNYRVLYTACTNPTASSITEFLDRVLELTDNDNALDVSAGIISNKKALDIIGFNPSINTNPEDIWVVGGDYNFLTGATTLDIVSFDAADDVSGLGARTIFIDGLDSTFTGITEIISLVGTTSVQSVNMFSRINFMNVETTGTYHGANFNNISAQTSDGKVIARIGGLYNKGTDGTANYGSGRTSLGIYSVPKDKTAYITSISLCNDANRKGNYALYKYINTDDTSPPVNSREVIWRCANISGSASQQFQQFIRVPEKSDIWMRCSTSGGTSAFTVVLTIVLIDNIIP